MRGQVERGARACVAFVGTLLQANLARCHHRHLRHGEHPVGEDQTEDDDEFEGDARFYRIAPPILPSWSEPGCSRVW